MILNSFSSTGTGGGSSYGGIGALTVDEHDKYYISNVAKNSSYTATLPESTTLTEILNVTGEGILIGILLTAIRSEKDSSVSVEVSNKSWLKVTIDGDVIYNRYTVYEWLPSSTSIARPRFMGLLTLNETTTRDGYTRPLIYDNMSVYFGRLVKNENITNGTDKVMLLPSHVHFKESMKIEANFLTNYSNNSEYPVNNGIETHYILI